MSGIVKEIVFPLDRSYYVSNNHDQGSMLADIFYATVDFNELKRLIKVSQEQDISIPAGNGIQIYPNKSSGVIKPKLLKHGTGWTRISMPTTYVVVNFDWLLGQVKVIEKGYEYTEYCLLDNDKLLVLGVEDSLKKHSYAPSATLITRLAATAQELLVGNNLPNVWEYFIDFITIDKRKSCKIALTDEAKQLVVKMRLRGMQGTTVYRTLQNISDAVERCNLQKRGT